jgi:tRNA G10  N-methylase Trm11
MFKLIPMDIKPKVNLNGKIKPNFYVINFSSDEESLCKMEMKYLFKKILKTKDFFSYHYIDPSRSPFIKHCISILYTGETLNDIIHKIATDNFSCEKFKVFYINHGDETIGHEKKRKIEYEVGQNIKGEAEMKNPELLLGITKVNEKWILGEYKKNEPVWKDHNKKPYSYSNALNSRVARAIVNIAVSNNLKRQVVDPCCGIGTVIIEALSLGINIKGWEINPMIAANAKINLKYLYYKNVITTGNMHDIEDKFDVSIIDLPYGLFSATTLKEQVDIMKTARRISDKMIIVTFEDMDKHILSSGFDIVDRCFVSKGRFKRYISICN